MYGFSFVLLCGRLCLFLHLCFFFLHLCFFFLHLCLRLCISVSVFASPKLVQISISLWLETPPTATCQFPDQHRCSFSPLKNKYFYLYLLPPMRFLTSRGGATWLDFHSAQATMLATMHVTLPQFSLRQSQCNSR